MATTGQPCRVGILLFDQVEVLDFAGPFEVLTCAVDEAGTRLCRVLTLAPAPEVTCAGGLVVRPARLLSQAPELDILVVPGGRGARLPADPAPLVEFLRGPVAAGARVVASVCTGAYLLARAGLLASLPATTHPAWLQDFQQTHPEVRVAYQKLTDTGRFITAGGVASGIDLGLHLLERFFGPAARQREALRLDGPWR